MARTDALPCLLLALLATGCTADSSIPAGAHITCEQTADCPQPDFLCPAASHEGATRLCLLRTEADKIPASSPELTGPKGQSAIKNGDALSVRGTCEKGATVVSVRLVPSGEGSAVSLPAASVTAADGLLSAELVAQGLTEGARVQLEVVVEAHGLASSPEKSRSLPLLVDLLPPGKPRVTVPEQVRSATLPLQLSSQDALELRLEGSLAEPVADGVWLPFTEALTVQLTPDDGPKQLVIRVRDGAHNEAASTALTTLDSHAPTAPSVRIEGKLASDVIGTPDVTLALGAQGATQVFIDGDLKAGPSTFTWVPLAASVPVTLLLPDGAKTVRAKFRDDAGNETAVVSDAALLATGAVQSAPVLKIPPGQTQIRSGNQLVVSGAGEPGATVDSARLVDVATGAGLQAAPVIINSAGTFSGVFDAGPLPDGARVALEVILSTRGLKSAPAASRSAPVTVDDTPPVGFTLTATPGPVVNTRAIALSLAAAGASELFLEGDLAAGRNVGAWIPFITATAVTLTPGDGRKTITARVRDGAFNEVSARQLLTVDSTPPKVTVTLAPPGLQRDVRSGDTLSIGGATEPGATLQSAQLIDESDAAVLRITGQLAIDPLSGAISGTVPVGVLGAATLRVEVVVSDGANASTARSAALTVDNQAPTAVSATIREATAAGAVAALDVTLLLGATGAREVFVEGDVKPGGNTFTWLPFAAQLQVGLTDAEGAHSVTVRFRDGAFNTASVVLSATVDRVPPLSRPALTLPAGQTAVTNGNALGVSGTAEAGSTLVKARLLDQAGVQIADVTGQVQVNSSGAITGALAPLAGLTASQLQLEVVVRDALNLSDALGSRSNSVPVDTAAPTSPSLLIEGKPVTGSQTVVLDLAAVGASEVFVDGAVVDDPSTKEWIPLTSQLTVTLTAGDGPKTVTASFRDGAFNTVAARADTITLNTAPVASAPTLTLPAGQSLVKNGDRLLFGGSGEPGAQLVSARLVDLSSGATAQPLPLPLSAITIDAGGVLTGTVITAGLVHNASVSLEVILGARGRTSAPSGSRSAPVTVDTALPTNHAVSVQQGSEVASTAVGLNLGVLGASEMFLDGALVPSAGVRAWIPVNTSASVTLTTGDGGKAIIARFRDGAFNEVQATTAVTLNTGVPTSNPSLTSPFGVAKAKKSDVLTVGGSAASGTTRTSASLIFFTSAGVELGGAGCVTDFTSSVTLTGTAFSGAVTVPDPAACAGAAQVALRVIVRNAAGTFSAPTASTSSLLALDNLPPAPGTASLKVVVPARAGNSRTAAVTLLLAASEPDASAVEVLITGDVASGARVNAWVPFPGTEVVKGEEPVTLASPDGVKNVTVQFRDVVQNTTAPVTVTITLDTAVPGNATAVKLKLVETSPAPTDPTKIADSNNAMTLTGLAGAIVNGDRAEIYSAASLSPASLLATINAVVTDGSFPATALATNPAKTFYVVALDAAGNRSAAATPVSTPTFAPFTAAPSPARSGAPMTLNFTSSVAISPAPTVTVGVRSATPVGGSGPTSWQYTFTPDGTEPEGTNKAVVRITGLDGRNLLGPGTSGTGAIATTLDFTPPIFNAAGVTLTQNAPGQVDTIVGAAGTASDAIAATSSLLASIYSKGGALLTTAPIAANGSFPVVSIGDNVNDGVIVTFTDTAGNETSKALPAALFPNDIGKPVLGALTLTPPKQRLGGTSLIDFTVSDTEKSNLAAQPVVTVGGRAATYVSGTLTTSDGAAHAFRYSFTVGAGDAEQPGVPANVDVRVQDVFGNPAQLSGALLIDKGAPSSVNTTPGGQATWNGRPAVLGTASDPLLSGGGAPSGVSLVEISLQRMSDLKWWNGSAFASTTEIFLASVGTSSWSFDDSAIPYAAGSYQLRSRATDGAGNVEAAPATRTFSYSTALPAGPATLTAASVGEATIHLAWSAASPAPASYRVYFDVEAGAHPPYAGTGAVVAASPPAASPLTVAGSLTSLDVTELPRGRYVFAVTAVDASNNESPYSSQAAAASRWWGWKAGPLTSNLIAAMTSPSAGVIVAVGTGGTIWRSTDSGATFSIVKSPTTQDLTAIWSSGSTVIAVGDQAIVRSTDAGATWTSIPTAYRLQAVWGNATAIMVGGLGATSFQRSTNGGLTFAAPTSPSSASCNQTFAIGGSATAMLAVGGVGCITRSADNGATWTKVISGLGSSLYAVASAGGNAVAVGGDGGSTGYIARSGDDGVTWARISTGSAVLRDVVVSGTDFLAAGAQDTSVAGKATLRRSTDGGLTFVATDLSSASTVSRLAVSGSTVVGAATPLVRSADGGATWSTVPAGMIAPLTAIVATGGSVVATSGGDSFTRSTDGGLTFTALATPLPPTSWVVWGEGDAVVLGGTGGRFYRSTDDGESFVAASSPSTGAILEIAGSGLNLSAITTTNTILRSADGGASWVQVPTPPVSLSTITKLVAQGSTRIIGADTGAGPATLFESSDSGASYTQRFTTVPNGTILDAACQGSTCLALGVTNSLATFVARTTNAGVSWSLGDPTFLPFFSNHVVAAPSGFAVLSSSSNSGGLFASTDGGASFTQVDVTPPRGSLWASGATFISTGQQKVRRSTTGVTGVYSDVPATFPLSNGFQRIFGAGNAVVMTAPRVVSVGSPSGPSFITQTHFTPGPFGGDLQSLYVDPTSGVMVGAGGVTTPNAAGSDGVLTFGPK